MWVLALGDHSINFGFLNVLVTLTVSDIGELLVEAGNVFDLGTTYITDPNIQ